MAKQDQEPRSIRLTQGHRADIADAVMKQWDQTNPVPAAYPFEQLAREALKKYLKPAKRTPKEFLSLKRINEATGKVDAALKSMGEDLKDYLNFHSSHNLRMTVLDANGDTGSVFNLEVPLALAQELNMNYVSTWKNKMAKVAMDTISNLNWRDYYVPETAEDGSVLEQTSSFEGNHIYECEFIRVAHTSKYNMPAFVIPHDMPGLTEYRRNKRKANQHWEERKRMHEELADYLAQFNTTKQIRDGWPELEPYLPAHIADPNRVIQLPAVAKSRLNERLGL